MLTIEVILVLERAQPDISTLLWYCNLLDLKAAEDHKSIKL